LLFLFPILSPSKLIGITLHAAIAFLDQQSPHNPSGTTNTSSDPPHPGNSRAGERSSTSPVAFISRINHVTDIANSTVFCSHTSDADHASTSFFPFALSPPFLAAPRHFH